jgi:hypothetical protein
MRTSFAYRRNRWFIQSSRFRGTAVATLISKPDRHVAQTGQESSLNGNEYPVRFSPDGLTEQLIDALLREVDGAAVAKPRPTSALMDLTGAQRRHRRRARRSVAAVVRALPRRTTGGAGGWAA